MEETRWWSKLFVVGALISIFLLITSPFGYKYGVFDLTTSFGSLMVALVCAIFVLLGCLIMVFVAQIKGMMNDRRLVLIAMALSLVPLVAMGPQIAKGRGVPPIHDISTDTLVPPEFQVIVDMREGAINSLEYTYQGSAVNLAKAQMAAYPDVMPLESELSMADAVNRAAKVLAAQGLDVVNTDPEVGIVEAIDTTFWFGFKDDLVVRVRPKGNGSIIDVRSVSRVGVSDVGVNAARILQFTAAF